MSATTVTLEQVIEAARARAASLVPETSGYLALAIGDATARLPLRVEPRQVTLSHEGTVTVARSRDVVTPDEAARVLRKILADLLACSTGSMPGLTSAARPRADEREGIEGVVFEIEAALIPVNRAAARRALARLARETARERPAAARKPRPAPVATPVEPPGSGAARTATPEPATLTKDDVHAVLEGGATPPPSEAASVRPPITVPSARLAPPEASDTPLSAQAIEADDEPLACLDEHPTTLDVVTEIDADSPIELDAGDGFTETPALAEMSAIEPAPDSPARSTRPFGLAMFEPQIVTPRPLPVRDEAIEAAALPAEAHVETLPMRFELGRVQLGADPGAVHIIEAPAEAAPVAAGVDAPAEIATVAAPAEQAPAPPRDRVQAGPAGALLAARREQADPAIRWALSPSSPSERAASQKAPRAPREAAAPRATGDAELSPSKTSDVDAMLESFAKEPLDDERSLRQFTAGLKAIAEIDATALPPPVAQAERPRAPPSTDAASSAPRPARHAPVTSALPEPRRRSSLAVSVALLLMGLVGTALIWGLHPEFFAGRGSPLAKPKAPAAQVVAPEGPR